MVCWFFGFIGLALTLLERGIREEGFVATSHLISGLVELYTSTYSRQLPPDVVSREAASKFHGMSENHGASIAAVRAATKVAVLSGELPLVLDYVRKQLGQKEKNKHKSIENNHGKIIANGKVS